MDGVLALLSMQPQVLAPGEEAGSGDKGLWGNNSQRGSALPNQGQGYTHHLPLTCQLDRGAPPLPKTPLHPRQRRLSWPQCLQPVSAGRGQGGLNGILIWTLRPSLPQV